MKYPMKQYEVLAWASSFLKKHGREEQIGEILLQHHLELSRSAFYMQMREPIDEDIRQAFCADVEKHVLTGMPVQHMTGAAPFYGRDFIVNPSVLIPRFDTEVLITHVLDYLKTVPNKANFVVVDVGTGSGIIAITLKLEMPELTVYATDISQDALNVAKQNAKNHHADIQFLEGNFLDAFLQKQHAADIIVSNPPYINYQDKSILADTVKEYDPSLALYAEEEGLAAYKEIITQSKRLNPARLKRMFFEIGYEQAAAVTSIIQKDYPQSRVEIYQDLNEKDRVVLAELP